MVTAKRWGLALQKNVIIEDEPKNRKRVIHFKPFRKFATRRQARVEHMQWPTPTYIVDLYTGRVVR